MDNRRGAEGPAAATLALVKTVGKREGAQSVRIDHLIIAGWTGRNVEALEKHIAELEKLGVARPKATPVFYRAAASLLTTAEGIEVTGDASSGEVEAVLLHLGDALWVGVGSDHTDRKVESINVTFAKQMCAKPMSAAVWRYDDVAPHWDQLVLRSWVVSGTERRRYQEGTLAHMRPPEELLARYREHGGEFGAGCAMFCGTLEVEGEIEPSEVFEFEMEDPVLQRRIGHRYTIRTLPVEI